MYETTPETSRPERSPVPEDRILPEDLADGWAILSIEERLEGFRLLGHDAAGEFFLGLSALDQAALVGVMSAAEARLYLRQLEPDDAADLLQAFPVSDRERLLGLLDENTRQDVTA